MTLAGLPNSQDTQDILILTKNIRMNQDSLEFL